MRQARIKVRAESGSAVYHCISRTVNGERLFDDEAKEMLRRQLRQIARYCGVEVITYAIMSNHFHILVRVPKSRPVADGELLERFRFFIPSRLDSKRRNSPRSYLNWKPEEWRPRIGALNRRRLWAMFLRS